MAQSSHLPKSSCALLSEGSPLGAGAAVLPPVRGAPLPIARFCRDHRRTFGLILAAYGCGGKASPPPDPGPVVFEDRLVISDTDDKSPLAVPPEQLPKPG